MPDAYLRGLNRYRRQARRLAKDSRGLQQVSWEVVKKADRHRGSLGSLFDELMALVRLARSWASGEYRQVSAQTKLLVAGGLLYFLSPVDLVPDFLAGLGLLDDAVLLGWIASSLRRELELFRQWEAARNEL